MLYPHRLLDFEEGKLKSSAARIGTATHQVMQFADFALLAADPEREFSRLTERGFLSSEDMALVEKDKIKAFFVSPLYAEMAASPLVEREKRFNVLLPALPLLGKEGEVLVQGVIDLYFEAADGTLTLVDFKTDRVKPENGEAVLRERHSRQLSLYAQAVESITGKKVGKKLLYSFALGKAVSL